MMISTRGRYALRVLLDLAQNAQDRPVPIKEVATRQDISLKYLERIMPLLSKGGFVSASSGRGGGYRLKLKPDKCRVGDILRLTEETLAPVACLSPMARACPRSAACLTLPMWQEFNDLANSFFDNITLAGLLGHSGAPDQTAERPEEEQG